MLPGAGIKRQILVDQGVRGVWLESYGLSQGPRSIRTGLAVVNVHTVGDTVVHEIAAEACGTGDGGMSL